MNLAPGVCDLSWLEPSHTGWGTGKGSGTGSALTRDASAQPQPVSHAWGLARAQESLLQSVKKALKRRGAGGKTQPDPTAIPSRGLQPLGWLCRAAVGQLI